MALFICPDCKNTVSEKADKCPHCGRPFTAEELASLKKPGKKSGCLGCGLLIIILVVVYTLFFDSDKTNQTPNNAPQESTVTSTAEWYEGGSLHRVTIAEWKNATPENKLATCADFIARLNENQNLNISVTTMDSLKSYSQELVDYIDLATSTDETDSQSTIEYIGDHTVGEIAAMGMILMGWTK